MPTARVQTQVKWSGSSSVNVDTATSETSDAFTFGNTTKSATIAIKGNFSGTPASGEDLTIYILSSNGDVDPTSSDDFETVGNAVAKAVIESDKDNPGVKMITLDVSVKSFKLHVIGSAGHRWDVWAKVTELVDR